MSEADAPLVLVSDPQFKRERVIDGLLRRGARTGLLPQGPDADTAALLGEADAVIVAPECELTAAQVAHAKKLRVAVSPVIGVDHLALTALADRGIRIAHGAAPVNAAGMAEAVVGLIVALMHRIPTKQRELLQGRPRASSPGKLVMGRTVGLVGAGRIGREVVGRLTGWGCEIVIADPDLSEEAAHALGARRATLEDLLRESDVVSIQVPLTDSTRGLIGDTELALMRPDAYLVNVSRGGIVDEHALESRLAAGRLAGAAIDVWAQEPPEPGHPLLAHESVIGTPHNVGHTDDAYAELADLAVDQVMRLLDGKPALYPVTVTGGEQG